MPDIRARARGARTGGPAPIRILLTLATLLAGPPAAAAPDAEPIRVGVYQNPPKIFVDDAGRPTGFFPELVRELAPAVGRPLVFVPCRWARCLERLAEGRLDLLPDMARTTDREARFRFGRQPALEARSWVMAPESAEPVFADLDGARTAVVRDSVQREQLRALADERGWTLRLVETGSMGAALDAVAEGDADFAVVNEFFARREAPDREVVRTPFVVPATPL